ncbi:IclR family transcriptional regulator [uncultured Jatrophihabitans sp.]|uniref:IclR family transcriptional regulator n=1 Tax=uncultured Jatrophihabitans sp. TaxID=1610747 RepID=UPI0035CB107C
MAGNVAEHGASVTARALRLLGAFDYAHRRLSLSDLAARAELPMPTAHRLVAELVAWGALTREPAGSYVVGRRMWDLGLLAPVPTTLRAIASPFLHDLYSATLATVHLAVRDGTQVLYLDSLRGHASVPIVSGVGSRLPMHATGVGKALLAFAPEVVVDEVLADLTRITPYTITQPGRLRHQLRRVRSDGFAHTSEEMSLGACSIAVPVRSSAGEVVAALGIVVADLRRERSRLVAALRVAVRGVERSIAEFDSVQ